MKATVKHRDSIDVERLFLVPIFVFLLVMNGASLWESRTVLEGGLELALLHGALVTAFYAMLVALMFFRAPAKGTTRSVTAVGAAYAGTFAPFLLIFVPRQATSQPMVLASTVLMMLGLGLTMYGLVYLGRSFGVVPSARVLVRSGPYRLVRHPLYAGECITFVGAVIAQLSAWSVGVLILWFALQVYRAIQEERVLRREFAEYEAYAQQTARFVPGLL